MFNPIITSTMKKFLFVAICALFATVAFAQSSESEHLTFKGVPIDGTLSQYVAKMKAAGFSYLGEEDGTALLKGDFAGFKGCTIGVSTLEGVDVVNRIVVLFTTYDEWSSLERDYNHLKDMLTKKYGEPSEVVQEFVNSYSSRNNTAKILALGSDECTWYTTFSTEKGDIQLALSKYDYTSGVVVLKYFDKINTEAVMTAAMDDL